MRDEWGKLRIWDLTSRAPVSTPIMDKRFWPWEYRVVDKGKSFAVIRDYDRVSVWDTRTGKDRFSIDYRPKSWQKWFEIHASTYSTPRPVFSSDRRLLAIHSSKNSVAVWDLISGKQLAELADTPEDDNGAFTTDGKSLVFKTNDHVEVRSLDGKQRKKFAYPRTIPGKIMESPDGQYVLAGAEGFLRLHDLGTGKECWSVPRQTSAFGMCFTEDSAYVLYVCDSTDRTLVNLFDVKTGKEPPSAAQTTEEDCLVEFLVPSRGNNHISFRSFYRQRASLSPTYESIERYAGTGDRWIIACASQGEVRLVESRTGRKIASFPQAHRGNISCVIFTPDGRKLITGSKDSSILLWDWPIAAKLKPDPSIRPNQSTWEDLMHDDAGKAYRAIFTLLAHPDESISLLKEHLKPTTEEEFARIRRWIAELDHDRYAVRERAQKALLRSGEEAIPLLQTALKRPASFESEQRIRALLASPELLKPGREGMRQVRAIQALEWMNTPSPVGCWKISPRGSGMPC